MQNTKITNKLSPAPIRDDIVGSGVKSLNQTWELWFRKIYDIVSGLSTVTQGSVYDISSISATPVPGFNYCLDGNRYFFNYKGTGDVEIVLPFPILYDVQYSWGAFNAGQKRIQLPNFGSTVILNEWFFVTVV